MLHRQNLKVNLLWGAMMKTVKAPNAYRTIGEISKELNIQPHIIRFWEQKFDQINPRINNGRRYYSAQDAELMKQLKFLLHNQGYSLKAAQEKLANPTKNLNDSEILRQIHSKFLTIKSKLEKITLE